MAVTASVTNALTAPVPSHGEAKNLQIEYWTLALATTDLQSGDTWTIGYLPPNARIQRAGLKCTDMDTNTTPTLAINIGTDVTADLIFAASTAGQAGTFDGTMAIAGRFFKTTGKTPIVGGPSTSAATAAAGTLELTIEYVVEDSATSY